MTFKNADKWIPSDFDPNKIILLAEKFNVSAKAEKKMENHMEDTYPYEFVNLKDIKSKEGKSANTKLYIYALVISSHTTTTHDKQASITKVGLTVTGFDFNFYDRGKDKNYPSTAKSSSYAIMTFKPTIDTIVKKIE